ncbi:FecR domain-containing protein [Alcaligenes sp. SORT26]|uniref:FecR family protein n=1 Tax=Alcaligenes sp. SORT26 TaxID=2813780 RepID=UPI001A9FA0BF|nr:FecR domain-containing protein [Alcaligenes sp. SORT26]QTC00155.1 FecR domain-containing protein [Alcaligenes sp. SORT26]
MTSESSLLPDNPHDAAAYWFARVHSGDFSVAEEECFLEWRRADSQNESEYRALESIWQSSLMIPDEELREMLEEADLASAVSSAEVLGANFSAGAASASIPTAHTSPASTQVFDSGSGSHPVWMPNSAESVNSGSGLPTGAYGSNESSRTSFAIPPNAARRRFLWQGATLGAVALLGAGGVYIAQQDTVSHALSYTTAFGEQKTVTLPDGSEVHMNVSTELVLHYQAHRRQLTLLKGEAMFAVQSDKNRPFIVDAGQVQVEVTGTVFNVRRHAQGNVEVAVTEGSVQVSSGTWWNRQQVSLTPGMLAQGSEEQAWSVQRTDVAARTAWRQGKMVFRDQTLDEVVQEMNRYLPEPIELMDEKLKRLRMAGVFNIEDAQGFLLALQEQLPVTVVTRSDGRVGITIER